MASSSSSSIPSSRKRRDPHLTNDTYSTTKRLAFCEPQLATGASHHVLLATPLPVPPQPPIKQRRMAAPQVLTSDHPYHHQHDATAVFRAPANTDVASARAAIKASF
ncbi:hypothetical protein GCK72_005479 [Caenorhabditis remanei]|uniref:Uncharacterized protein n=1 Tax=Caenorhabditis remanei TaxID=31234 RepID=A0A6A5HEM8_CAERE|nr:hypothetical protein GCK72_005479 [Caenorhabditis remanei]KAF1765527.1 hypothetical protein GCK72_005479 [Caenorhabditis remanei]